MRSIRYQNMANCVNDRVLPRSYTNQSASLWHVTDINYIRPVRFEGPGGKCQNWIREAYKL